LAVLLFSAYKAHINALFCMTDILHLLIPVYLNLTTTLLANKQ